MMVPQTTPSCNAAVLDRKATALSPWKGRATTPRGLQCASGLFLGFQRVQDYRPPDWPDQHQPQQVHPDFEVDDLGHTVGSPAGGDTLGSSAGSGS